MKSTVLYLLNLQNRIDQTGYLSIDALAKLSKISKLVLVEHHLEPP